MHSFKKKLTCLILSTLAASFLTTVVHGAISLDQSWPRLIASSRTAAVQQVYKASQIAFASKYTEIGDAGEDVQKQHLGLILGPKPVFWYDPKYIEAKHVGSGTVRYVYWQKQAQSGGRFVVVAKPMNWQGDWYDLFFVNADVEPSKLVDFASDTNNSGQCGVQRMDNATILYRDCWHRPWLYYNAKLKQVIAVDPKADWLTKTQVFPDWAVYAPSGNSHVKRIATISFAPASKGIDVPPSGPIREMAQLLDKVIGVPQSDEGTLQPTARLRGEAGLAWANLMLRPWAMAKPKNTRAEVERGLKVWEKGSPVYRQQYRELHALYPKAEAALCDYYQKHLHKSGSAAKALAATSMDIAYRSNFCF